MTNITGAGANSAAGVKPSRNCFSTFSTWMSRGVCTRRDISFKKLMAGALVIIVIAASIFSIRSYSGVDNSSARPSSVSQQRSSKSLSKLIPSIAVMTRACQVTLAQTQKCQTLIDSHAYAPNASTTVDKAERFIREVLSNAQKRFAEKAGYSYGRIETEACSIHNPDFWKETQEQGNSQSEWTAFINGDTAFIQSPSPHILPTIIETARDIDANASVILFDYSRVSGSLSSTLVLVQQSERGQQAVRDIFNKVQATSFLNPAGIPGVVILNSNISSSGKEIQVIGRIHDRSVTDPNQFITGIHRFSIPDCNAGRRGKQLRQLVLHSPSFSEKDVEALTDIGSLELPPYSRRPDFSSSIAVVTRTCQDTLTQAQKCQTLVKSQGYAPNAMMTIAEAETRIETMLSNLQGRFAVVAGYLHKRIGTVACSIHNPDFWRDIQGQGNDKSEWTVFINGNTAFIHNPSSRILPTVIETARDIDVNASVILFQHPQVSPSFGSLSSTLVLVQRSERGHQAVRDIFNRVQAESFLNPVGIPGVVILRSNINSHGEDIQVIGRIYDRPLTDPSQFIMGIHRFFPPDCNTGKRARQLQQLALHSSSFSRKDVEVLTVIGSLELPSYSERPDMADDDYTESLEETFPA